MKATQMNTRTTRSTDEPVARKNVVRQPVREYSRLESMFWESGVSGHIRCRDLRRQYRPGNLLSALRIRGLVSGVGRPLLDRVRGVVQRVEPGPGLVQ